MNTRIGNYPIHKRITYPRATQPRIPPSPQAHRASTEGHPAHRCAQTVDHLDQKQPKTPISSEVDCALGQGHNTTNNNQRPSKHPVHKTRPGHCGELHAKFGEVAQRTCGIDGIDGIYGRMQTQSLPGHPWPTATAVPKTQTTSAQTTKIQPLWPRWSALWANCRRGPSSPAHSDCRHHLGGRGLARG